MRGSMRRITSWVASLLLLAVAAAAQQPGGRFTLPASVHVKKDISYAATSDPRQTLDLYLPEAPKGNSPLPVVVNIHGGAFKMVSSKVACVVDQFGPSDLLAMGGGHDSPGSPESELIGGALQENKDKARAASPITYVTRADPPFLILHGTKDPLVPFNQSERLAAALKEAGVPCVFVAVEGAGHGGFRSREVPKRIRQFFDKHLRGQAVGTISAEPIPNGGPAPTRAAP